MRRTEPIIRFDILQALAFQGPLKITHLTCKANIGFKKLENFLDNLLAEGLVNEREIDNKHIVYLITTKGLRAFKDSPRVTSCASNYFT
jgi:predicted transcriptional regulator